MENVMEELEMKNMLKKLEVENATKKRVEKGKENS